MAAPAHVKPWPDIQFRHCQEPIPMYQLLLLKAT